MPLLELWASNPSAIDQLAIEQIIATAGSGNLQDNSDCSRELREYLMEVNSRKLSEYINRYLVLLRQEIARSDVTVRATLREHFLGETGHERGSAGTVYGLRRGAGRGDWACRSGGAVA